MKRAFVHQLKEVLLSPPKLIQVILGPRQVGKTTGILQLQEELPEFHFIIENADSIFSTQSEWLRSLWAEI